jgi:hypothetical protein
MWRKIVAMALACAVPAAVSAGPLREAVEKAGREVALAQQAEVEGSRARLWTGIGLIAGGSLLAALSAFEIGDDENGPDDGEDFDESDDGEDSDGWGGKAMLGGGIAAAALGSVLLLTGRGSAPTVAPKKPGLVVSPKKSGIAVRQTLRF